MVDFRKMISAKSRAKYDAAREQIAAFQAGGARHTGEQRHPES